MSAQSVPPLPVATSVSGTIVLSPSVEIRSWQAVRAVHGADGPCGDRTCVLSLRSGRTAIVLVDVAGHGASRARLSTAVSGAILESLRRGASPASALAGADARLRNSGDELPYAVAFVALVHPVLRTVVYASAAHDCAFVLADAGRIHRLGPTAPMLGIPLTMHPCEAVFPLGLSDTLVLATDGISDSRPVGSVDFFGAEGAARTVERSWRRGGDPAQAVLESACIHAGGRQADDAGVVVMRLGPVTGNRHPRTEVPA